MWLAGLQVGYYFSAFTVDKLWMGRVRLQSMVSCATSPWDSCPLPSEAVWDANAFPMHAKFWSCVG